MTHNKVSHETLALINQIRAEHRAKFKRQPQKFPGLKTNSNRRHKYDNCEHTGTVRQLSPAEIDEFRAHIQRCIDPSLRIAPVFRRNVV